VERRLAAILAADVVGYSRLMQADEAGTLAALKSHRSAILNPLVRRHRGRIVKVMGDGVLVEFASAVKAVECAVELQTAMAAANNAIAEAQRIVLRVGINLGDVMVEGSDLYGDGVNIAARLEGLAEPGGIYVSQAVVSHVRGKVALDFDNLGEQRLKNMAEPVGVYRVRMAGAPPAALLLALRDKPSIAVLPFQNMSGDPAQEYFSDGIVEDIITALSRFRNLVVIARNSTFAYKGRTVDVAQIGRELSVAYVLEGSVRKEGDRLRITAQLIDAASGASLWGDRFDGTLAEVFDLQDQVAANVVGAIGPRVQQAEIERAKRKPTEDLNAYDHYLRGMAVLGRITPETTSEALRLSGKAIERDPDYALAHAMAAQCYGYRKVNGWMEDRARESAEAERLARRGVEAGRDDAIVLSHCGLAIGYVAGDLDDGAALVERALTLNPNLAAAWGYSSWMKSCLGEPDTAVAHAAIAMRLSPLDTRLFAWEYYTALAHFCAARYDDAVTWAERAMRDQPNFATVTRVLAASYALAGRLEDAQQAIGRLRQFDPALRLSSIDAIIPPLRRADDRARFLEGLRQAGLPE
jgi:TolB-like protein/class 3 adenylate cyclase/Tfp pilus assembly protein PilF